MSIIIFIKFWFERIPQNLLITLKPNAVSDLFNLSFNIKFKIFSKKKTPFSLIISIEFVSLYFCATIIILYKNLKVISFKLFIISWHESLFS